MGNKEKANEKIKDLYFESLSESLDEATKRHIHNAYEGGPALHSKEHWDTMIAHVTTDLPEDERIPVEKLKKLLEGRVRPLLNNDCILCGRLVKYFSEKYGLD
jgi:hypothetical protein